MLGINELKKELTLPVCAAIAVLGSEAGPALPVPFMHAAASSALHMKPTTTQPTTIPALPPPVELFAPPLPEFAPPMLPHEESAPAEPLHWEYAEYAAAQQVAAVAVGTFDCGTFTLNWPWTFGVLSA